MLTQLERYENSKYETLFKNFFDDIRWKESRVNREVYWIVELKVNGQDWEGLCNNLLQNRAHGLTRPFRRACEDWALHTALYSSTAC